MAAPVASFVVLDDLPADKRERIARALDRLRRREMLDAWLAELQDELGPLPNSAHEAANAAIGGRRPARANSWDLLRSDLGADSQTEVANGDTTLGLIDWLENRRGSE